MLTERMEPLLGVEDITPIVHVQEDLKPLLLETQSMYNQTVRVEMQRGYSEKIRVEDEEGSLKDEQLYTVRKEGEQMLTLDDSY